MESVILIKGKYGYRVVLIYADKTSQKQQKSGFNTERESEKAREKTNGELHSGTYVVYANAKAKDFFKFWLEEDIKNRVGSNDTYTTYRNIICNQIIPILGKKMMLQIYRSDVQRLYNVKTEFSIHIARLVKTVKNTSLNYAVRKKVISENPEKGIDLPKRVAKKQYHTHNISTKKTLTLEQMLQQLETSKANRIHIQVVLNILMRHSKELITVDLYGDNRNIIANCIDELQPFIEEVLHEEETVDLDSLETVIGTTEYLFKIRIKIEGRRACELCLKRSIVMQKPIEQKFGFSSIQFKMNVL